MKGRKKDPAATEATRNSILNAGYDLFAQKSVEAVSVAEIAKRCGLTSTTVYRYFSSKPALVVAAAMQRWTQFLEENKKNRPSAEFSGMTAAPVYGFFLDSFLNLYKNHRNLLRFNQYFNIYISSERVAPEMLSPYLHMTEGIATLFHVIFEKGAADGTVRTDVPEDEMFRTSLHLMLAAATRYAVGLAYQPESDAETLQELETLRDMLYCRYTAAPEA